MNTNIKISGIIPLKQIPDFLYCLPHNEISHTHKLSLSKNRPGIKKIINLDIKISISSYKKNFTSTSTKLNINGIKHITFMYNCTDNEIHTAKYDIPFSIPVILNDKNINIQNVLVNTTKLSVNKIGLKSFYLTSTIFAVVLTKDTSSPKKPIKKSYENPISKSTNNHIFSPNLIILLLLVYLFVFKDNCLY